MIEGYVGLIGGGKSLNATDRATDYWAGGGVVCSNMTFMPDPWYNLRYESKMKSFRLPEIPVGDVRVIGGVSYVFEGEDCLARLEGDIAYANSCGYKDYLRRRKKWEFQDGQFIKLKNSDLEGELHALIPKGTPDKPVLLIIDEAIDFFDTDDRGTANKEFLSFLRHSRKQSVDVIFIAQDYTEINKRIRNQTQFVWTFWDMATFKIPGLRSTLPPPWRNMILCQQWNKEMKGGVLKRVWKSRDVDLFGCYKTDELFRSLKSADGKTDFSGEGAIKKESKKMNMFEKVALFLCMLFSALSFFRGGNAVAETVSVDSASSIAAKVENSEGPPVEVLYGRFRYLETDGESDCIYVDGIEYMVGQQTTAGVVLSATGSSVHILGIDGKTTFIYPDYGYRTDIPEDPQVASRPESVSKGTATASGQQET
ncbi:MAG: zonular occludens toxin domain-containing protein [Pontiella sp.]